MQYLILSDIHANLEALGAVCQAAAGQYDHILCLGDLVGYGPDPNAVVEWAREHVATIVRGNHDKAACGIDDPAWFNPVAEAAARWTRAQLTAENEAYVRGLAKGPRSAEGYTLAHGSPLDEDGYIATLSEARQVFQYIERPVTFIGHTHVQGGFECRRREVRQLARRPVSEEGLLVELRDDTAYLLNPGSVGQPRDGDPRAGYLTYDSLRNVVRFHRVEYDVTVVQARIRRAGLPAVLADRLSSGR